MKMAKQLGEKIKLLRTSRPELLPDIRKRGNLNRP
jgi:hypothetical protein